MISSELPIPMGMSIDGHGVPIYFLGGAAVASISPNMIDLTPSEAVIAIKFFRKGNVCKISDGRGVEASIRRSGFEAGKYTINGNHILGAEAYYFQLHDRKISFVFESGILVVPGGNTKYHVFDERNNSTVHQGDQIIGNTNIRLKKTTIDDCLEFGASWSPIEKGIVLYEVHELHIKKAYSPHR